MAVVALINTAEAEAKEAQTAEPTTTLWIGEVTTYKNRVRQQFQFLEDGHNH